MKSSMPEIHPVCKLRSGLLCFLFLIGFSLIGMRLVYLQVFQAAAGAHQVKRQHQQTVLVKPDRGVIVDRMGHPLALNVEVSSLYARPSLISKPAQVAKTLARPLEIPRRKLKALLSRDQPYVWIKRHLSDDQANQFSTLEIPGIFLTKEPQRFYPKGELVSHVLGFAGVDSQGLEGVEFQYESFLRGENNLIQYQRDALGRKIASSSIPQASGHQLGFHLTLTIDEVIQYIAQDELTQAVKKAGAKSGNIIIMDPLTGAILAWALNPTFDPNRFSEFSPGAWRNRLVTDSYEPGSTLKIVVAAAALEEGLMNPDTLIYGGEGQITVAGTVVHDPSRASWLTFSEAVVKSSNVGAIKMAVELGEQKLLDYLQAFGFGEKTGIDLPGESSGILRELSQWSGRSLPSIAMGHEIAVTPIQMVTAMAVIANGGWLMKPFVVSSVVDSRGTTVLMNESSRKRQPLSEATAQSVSQILEATVEVGTGKRARLTGYRAAGKTGTAQKFDSQTGRYSSTNVIASFVGFAPVEHPRLAMLVVLDEPQKGNWGGEVAAPVFRKVAERVLPHLGVLPGGSQIIRTAGPSRPATPSPSVVH